MLGPGERDVLKQLDWQGKADHLVDATMAEKISPPGQKTRWRLRRRGDGACIFLDDDNLCLIHKHFGPATKPLLCRLYPFGFYPVGTSIGVDVSFYCRAVAEGHGEAVQDRVPEWTRLLESGDGDIGPSSSLTPPKGTVRHSVRPGVSLSGDLVWEFEHQLLTFLEDETTTLFDRVRAALQFLRLGTTGDPASPTAAALRDAMAKGIPMQIARQPSTATMDKTQRAIFYQWLFLHLNPPPHDVHQRPPHELQKEQKRRIDAGKRYLHRKGRPWIDDRELSVGFPEIDAVDGDVFDTDDGEPSDLTAPVQVYLRAKILGQRFLVVGEEELPFVEAAQKFFLVVPMTLWTAKALAADRGAKRVELADVRGALRLIDRTLGTLPTSALPRKQAEACQFIMLETDLVEAAIADVTAS